MSSTGITSPIKAAIQGSKGSGAQIVKIIKLPQAIQNSAQAIRLEGKISSQNPDNGIVRIETEKGAVEVKVNGNKQPQIGQKLEIEIPAGRQPRQATIRTDSTPQNTTRGDSPPQNTSGLSTKVTATQAQPTTPPQTAINAQVPKADFRPNVQGPGQPPTTPTTTQQSPVAQTIAQNTTNLLQTARNIASQLIPSVLQDALAPQKTNTDIITPRTITPDTLVRLISISLPQAQNIAKEFITSLPQPITNIINKAVFTSNLIAENIVQNTIAQTIPPTSQTPIQIPATPQTQSAAPIIQPPQNSPQPLILTNNFAGQPQTTVQNALQQTTLLQSTVLNSTQPLTPNQLLPPAAIANIIPPLTAPSAATITPTPATPQTATLVPLTFDPANPIQNTAPRINTIAQLDVQIIKVTPSETILIPPVINDSTSAPTPAAIKFNPPLISANNAITLTAQVTAFTPQGLPLVTVQGLGGSLPQSFILQTPNTNLQLGNQLQIIPKNTAPIAAQVSPVVSQTLRNPLLQGFQWPALDDLYYNLQQLSPQAAASLTRSLPNAANPTQIAPAAMMFIAAVKSGNLENWLGDKKIDLLQQAGRGGLLKGLTMDSTARTGAPDPAIQSDWRAVPLPMFWEGEIHKITLYTRNENQNHRQEQNENGSTRFIFDLNLTRMGDVQIDGLYKDNRLDLLIRTQSAFSEPMQQTMRQSYSSALKQTELTGELNFQGSTENWVHVLKSQEQLGVHV